VRAFKCHKEICKRAHLIKEGKPLVCHRRGQENGEKQETRGACRVVFEARQQAPIRRAGQVEFILWSRACRHFEGLDVALVQAARGRATAWLAHGAMPTRVAHIAVGLGLGGLEQEGEDLGQVVPHKGAHPSRAHLGKQGGHREGTAQCKPSSVQAGGRC